MLFMFQNKDKDLLGIYQYGCDPFCVSLLTDRHLRVLLTAFYLRFRTNARLRLHVTRSITRTLHAKKLAHDIVRYISKFQRSDRHN